MTYEHICLSQKEPDKRKMIQNGSEINAQEKLQSAILRVLESGLFQRIRRRWMASSYRCTGLERVTSQTNISLREAQGAFYILGIGIVAAILILIVESVSKSRCWSYKPGFVQGQRIGPQGHGEPHPGRSRPDNPQASPGRSMEQYDVEAGGLAIVDCQLRHPGEHMQNKSVPPARQNDSDENGQPKLRRRNGFVPNGDLNGGVKALGGLHYTDLFTGLTTPSGLVYDVTEPASEAARCKFSEPPTRRCSDGRLSVRRRCNSCGAMRAAISKTVKVNNNDAETGEVTIRSVADVSYL
ncbi:hypothetical protein LSH36_788g00022 [Paralvinella palmiformis]|uniref:Uncharacterized protein n=1 Tax=Paralvinella palmiformis TaxID=53620 RepID=A0AAD9MV29_9ANNE|nr:hypothetical protein LSH36_788g00022 [Paralvinella palmiformis]